MTDATPRRDLTRWNRAGLKRFAYVDGNAATWLEMQRIAMLVRFLRGADGEERTEARWREAFASPPSGEERARLLKVLERLQWQALKGQDPASGPLTVTAHNRRLTERYEARSDDLAMEMMRATARAAHVLLGHVDAFANEGYLRTATQWESMRKLTAMIGYHPAPGAAASTVVGLIVAGSDIPAEDEPIVEIERGVPLSFTPPGGGKPVIFETIDTIRAHVALNAARLAGHDFNERVFATAAAEFTLPKGAAVKPGDVAVLTDAARKPAGPPRVPTYVLEVTVVDVDAGRVQLTFDTGAKSFDKARTGDVVLFTRPEKVQRPLLRSTGSSTVFESQSPLLKGDIVYLVVNDGPARPFVIRAAEGLRFEVELPRQTQLGDQVQFSVASRYTAGLARDLLKPGHGVVKNSAGVVLTGVDVPDLSFMVGFDVVNAAPAGFINLDGLARPMNAEIKADADKGRTALLYKVPERANGTAFAPSASTVLAWKVAETPPIFGEKTTGENLRKVEFAGKPSPALVAGAWFIARSTSGELKQLEVKSLRIGPDSHFVEFGDELPAGGSSVEYHGPMLLALRPVDHDRGQAVVADSASGHGLTLADLPPAARGLVKIGSRLIVEADSRTPAPVPAPVLMTVSGIGVSPTGELKLTTFEAYEAQPNGPLKAFRNGSAVLCLNTARATHGETRGTKVLGSGNAELARQSFNLPIREITFVPSSASETGVVPDMDVAVQDVVWSYRDLADPDAEDTDSWSYILRDDDTLDIVFRRRLPTGIDNVIVRRHRVGSGPSGNSLPAHAVTAPARRSSLVSAILQPFVADGGADREPVAMLRRAAPSRLVANGRAVSPGDFPRLLSRHASVQEAQALDPPNLGAVLRLVVVPAAGETVSPGLRHILAGYLEDRSPPGTQVEIVPFAPIRVEVEATLRIEVARYNKDDVVQAAKALLLDRFGLRHRRLGQSLTIGEVLAALEEVEGIENATAQLHAVPTRVVAALGRWLPYGAKVARLQPLRLRAGGSQAVSPDIGQLAYVTDTTLIVEAIG